MKNKTKSIRVSLTKLERAHLREALKRLGVYIPFSNSFKFKKVDYGNS